MIASSAGRSGFRRFQAERRVVHRSSLLATTLAAVLLVPSAWGDEVSANSSLDDLLAVRVSATSRHEQTARRAPGSLTIITAEDIDRFGYRTLAEVLSTVPGLFLGYDRNYSYLGVRGFGRPADYNNRVLVMIDGHRLNDDFYGYAPIGQDLPIDLRAVDRIEVVLGPGSASFGAGAMLATVNIVLKGPRSLSGDRVGIEGGSFGRERVDVLLGYEWGQHSRGLISATRTEVDGDAHFYPEYEEAGISSGRVVGADAENSRGAVATFERGGFRAMALATDSIKLIPTGSFETIFADRRSRTRDRWSGLDLRYDRSLRANVALSLRGGVGTYLYDGTYAYEDGVFRDTTRTHWWSAEPQIRWEPRPEWRTVLGAATRQVARSDYRIDYAAGGQTIDIDVPHEMWSVYAEQEFQPSDRWILTGGLRHDSYSRTRSATTPRLAVVFVPSARDTFKLLWGQAFRAPSVYETDFGGEGSELRGNSDLTAETVETAEFLWERRLSPAWLATASVYGFHLDDVIDVRQDADGGQFANLSGVDGYGFETVVKGRWPSGWLVRGGVSIQRTEGPGGVGLTNSPAAQVKLGLSAPIASGVRLSVDTLYESSRVTTRNAETDPYWVVNTNLTYRPERWPVDLSVHGRNLFDEHYAHPGGLEHRQDSIQQDGRTWSFQLGYTF